MFGKIPAIKNNAFEQSIATKQHQTLRENLEKLAVSTNEQEKIMQMRSNSCDEYRMSRCFWFLENHTIPETRTKFNEHHFQTFEKCQRELSETLEPETEEHQSEGMTFR